MYYIHTKVFMSHPTFAIYSNGLHVFYYVEATPEIPTETIPKLVKERLFNASNEICGKFSDLVCKTIDCLIKKGVTAVELSGFVLIQLAGSRMDYPADLPDKLEMCKDVRGVLFRLMEKGCDIIVFYDFDILQKIIYKHCEEEKSVTEELQQYKVSLDEYLKIRIGEHPLFEQTILGSRATSLTKMYLYMDSTWTENLHQSKLYKLQKRVATLLECGNIELIAVWTGSLCLCYNILRKDFALSELHIEQVLKLINFGVKEISGFEYSKNTEKACKFVYVSL